MMLGSNLSDDIFGNAGNDTMYSYDAQATPSVPYSYNVMYGGNRRHMIRIAKDRALVPVRYSG